MLGAAKVSGSRKLPVLDHDGIRIEDSTQILAYLETICPNPPLYPTDAAELALCNILEDWADESLYYYDIALHFSFPENARRRADHLLYHEKPWLARLLRPFVPAILRKAGEAQGAGRRPRDIILADIDRHVGSIASLLETRAFVAADYFTAADISIYVELDAIKVAELGADIIARHPNVVLWMERVCGLSGPSISEKFHT